MAKPRKHRSISSNKRPLGVTIVVALEILAAIYLVLGAAVFGAFGLLSGFIGAVAGFGSSVLLVWVVILLISAYGFWDATKWGWWLGIAIGGVLILSVVFLDVLGLVVGLMLVYYLTRKNVKDYFKIR
jgi:hypothetical protein